MVSEAAIIRTVLPKDTVPNSTCMIAGAVEVASAVVESPALDFLAPGYKFDVHCDEY